MCPSLQPYVSQADLIREELRAHRIEPDKVRPNLHNMAAGGKRPYEEGPGFGGHSSGMPRTARTPDQQTGSQACLVGSPHVCLSFALDRLQQ